MQGERPAPSVCEPGSLGEGTGTRSGWGQLQKRQCGVGEEGKGGGWRSRQESESRKAEGKPTWGAGMGRRPRKVHFRNIRISLKEGEKEESIGERVGSRGLVVKPAMKSTTLGRDVTEVVKKRDQPSLSESLGSGGLGKVPGHLQ